MLAASTGWKLFNFYSGGGGGGGGGRRLGLFFKFKRGFAMK